MAVKSDILNEKGINEKILCVLSHTLNTTLEGTLMIRYN